MGAASVKPEPCRLVMAGHVPGEELRVCLDALGRSEVVNQETGESNTQGGYVTHSMMRLPDGAPFLLRLRQHSLHIDAVHLCTEHHTLTHLRLRTLLSGPWSSHSTCSHYVALGS